MCGIAGFISGGERPGLLGRMLEQIAHRGPDGHGQWQGRAEGWRVELGHHRLAIIDPAGGAQPLTGRGTLSFNGEIYNFRELRSELAGRGAAFRTESDTEVLLTALEIDGAAKTLPRLNGMFAFAFWQGNRLLLARDRAGIKPLYYAPLANGEMVFASELSAVLEHPLVARKIDPAALAEYFFLDYCQPPSSFVAGVRKLEPGTFVEWENGKLSHPRPYWQLAASEQTALPPEKDLAADLWRRLGAAVERQMISDVPLGLLLSGGIDSSAIAVLAAKTSPRPLLTFSIGFEDPTFDESAHARTMAKAIGSEHAERIFSETALLAEMETVLSRLDEPVADPSLLPTSLLARLASESVKVALGGDGGDELWAGYPTYRAASLASAYQRLPGVLRHRLIPAAVGMLPVSDAYQGFEWKAKRFAQRWDDDPLRRHFRWMSNTDISDLPAIRPGLNVEKFWSKLPKPDPLTNDLALDFLTYLPGSVLAKVDRASMAQGLEVRPPFLDTEFVDWSFSIPFRYKLRDGQSKYLLKMAAAPFLPRSILERPKKGFGIPLGRWLRGPLAPALEAVLRESPLWDFLQRDTFRAWQREHLAGRVDRSKPLWALIVLDRWAQRFGCSL